MTSRSLTFGQGPGADNDDWLTVELAELRRAYPDRDWQPDRRHRWRAHDLQRDMWWYVQFTAGSTAYATLPVAAEYVETYPYLDRAIDQILAKAAMAQDRSYPPVTGVHSVRSEIGENTMNRNACPDCGHPATSHDNLGCNRRIGSCDTCPCTTAAATLTANTEGNAN